MMIINDINFSKKIIDEHISKLESSNIFNMAVFDFTQAIMKLIQEEHNNSSTIYGISDEPCLSSFVPLEMYGHLIAEDFPDINIISDLISHRLDVIAEVPKKVVIFNKDSMKIFVETGNLFLYDYKYLKPCSIEDRIIVLKNFLNALNDKNITLRAFDKNKINVTNNFEITEIRDSHSFSLFIYTKENTLKLINISEPTISNSLINFITDIIETKHTYSLDETKQLVIDAIQELETKLANQ